VTAYTSHSGSVAATGTTRDRIAALVRRYPHVSETDRKEILHFMKTGRHLDIGLLTANDNVRPQLDAFMAEHKRHFRIGIPEIARLFAVIAAAIMVCWLPTSIL